ncbi:Ig-like domain-containing protein [Myxococcota bacterium]|nr:Ig-like domain-containing protein [Myxococcota bacterium]
MVRDDRVARRLRTQIAFWALVLTGLLTAPTVLAFTNFESHQIHPIDLTPDGSRLLVVNTPDSRLAIFAVGAGGALSLESEVPVGLEPVSVRARSNDEAWVVNHLSDSVSVVSLVPGEQRVTKTVPTDDEPSDVVFAGTGDSRAFVSISQRNRVDVYDAEDPGLVQFEIEIDGEDPRALARNASGTEVFAAVFHSGNQTLVISGEANDLSPLNTNRVSDPSGPYGGAKPPPPPGYDAGQVPFLGRPVTSLIAKWRDCEGGPAFEWCDDNDKSWNDLLETPSGDPIQMPDRDVARIDADAATPVVSGYVASVGTLNFGIEVNPVTNRIYVANTEALNHIRFEEGMEILGDGLGNEDGVCDHSEAASLCTPSLRGHLVDTRISVLDGSAVQGFIDLNPHIDYEAAITSVDKSLSIGQPNGMAFDSSGSLLYAAALLSEKVAVIDTSSVPGTIVDRIDVGEGPTGVALDEIRSRLYVLNRHENTVSVVDTATRQEVGPRIALFNPEPPILVTGRRFLYDAQETSGRGDVACASCHPFGNLDLLAWDLGTPPLPPADRPAQLWSLIDPFGLPAPITPGLNTGLFVECGFAPNQNGCGSFTPLKGPRTTQTLREIIGTEPFHWHGDRINFQDFNGAFPGLMMRSSTIADADMIAFGQFIGQLSYPPNPNRGLDDSLQPMDIGGGVMGNASAGKQDYLNSPRDNGRFTCNDCHLLPTGTNKRFINGIADQGHQAMKVAQLRNMYEKTGMTLHPEPEVEVPATTRSGFGFAHSGEINDLDTFLRNPVFNFVSTGSIQALNDNIAFMFQFPTSQHAGVGHAVLFDGSNNSEAGVVADLGVLLASLNAGGIELVVRHSVDGVRRSSLCTAVSASEASCQPDRAGEAPALASSLRMGAQSGAEVTFMAVPIAAGGRMGLDRDGDGFYDRSEIDVGADPADPLSTPDNVNTPPTANADGMTLIRGGTASVLDGGASSVLDNDIDGEGNDLTAAAASMPSNGSLSLEPDGTFLYIHDGSSTQADSFTYTAHDGTQSSSPATVTITVQGPLSVPAIGGLGWVAAMGALGWVARRRLRSRGRGTH